MIIGTMLLIAIINQIIKRAFKNHNFGLKAAA